HLTSVHAGPASGAQLLVDGCEIVRSGMIGRFRKQFEIFKNPAAAPAACADIAHFLGIGGLKNQAGLFRLIEYLDSLLLIDRTSQPVFLVISSSQAKNQAGLKRPVTACAHHLVLPSAYAWSDYDFILAG